MNSNIIANSSGATQSLWMEVTLPDFPPLKSNLNADVCIVGAGIVGLTCAYTLAKNGKSVIILDQGVVAGGQTARTTAHLTWLLDDRYYNLIKFFGVDGARLAAESHSAAIDYIEKIVKEENIECDLERIDGYLFVPPGDTQEELDKEYNAFKKIGREVNKVERAPFSKTFDTGPCLQLPHQAQFHVLKYIQGLLKVLQRLGVQIYCHTHVSEVKDGTPCKVITDSCDIVQAKSVIVSTCTPVNDRVIIHTKQAAYRTYVIAATVPKNSVLKGLYYDTLDPYHYIRIQNHLTNPELDWLIIGGEDHRTGQDPIVDRQYDYIEEWSRERFPMMNEIEYKWSGQIYEPVDSLAFIGRNPLDKHVYIATGDSGNGITHGTIAGILLPDLILGRKNPWEHLYHPSRKTLTAAAEYIEENCNTAMQYGDWLTPGEKKQIENLPPDEGMILREGVKKIAVYKDLDGKVHLKSAFCPHLGGCLRWNHGEKSWDCPAHGSRFDGCGHMITGPANRGLYDATHQS